MHTLNNCKLTAAVICFFLFGAHNNRTRSFIAHHLSTIKDADIIVLVRTGTVLEQGTHDELLANKGEYTGLVRAQGVEALKEESSEPDESDDGEQILQGNAEIPLTKYSNTLTKVGTGSQPQVLFYALKQASIMDLGDAV
ncbi:hypothetical protein V1509DRAFT_104176 [Lipomyces kononenkoae]